MGVAGNWTDRQSMVNWEHRQGWKLIALQVPPGDKRTIYHGVIIESWSMITSGVLIPSLVISVIIIAVVVVVLVDSIMNDVDIYGVLILFYEVIFNIDFEWREWGRIVNVLRKGVPEFWTIYLDHFSPIVYKVSPLGK